ncbi:MAG TPA: hypothetical protein PKD26_11055 [Pyrinomonadaceae bacterium]|nr:hypothetical protein [Pyrinomonadaceae bacterium]
MKKIAKRILLILLAVILAVQVPFIYRRWKIAELGKKTAELHQTRVGNQQIPNFVGSRFTEYKGIIHAHTSLGGHSSGTFEELIAAANENDLDFVIMTEHWSDQFDTSALTLNGFYGKTLFIGGNEIDTATPGDRFLMLPGSSEAAGMRKFPTDAVVEKLRSEKRISIVTYPERFRSWDAAFDGIEVFSVHTNGKSINPFTGLFDAIWSFPAYPELTLATYFRRPDDNIRRFDEVAAQRQISMIAGTDAHSNIGFHLLGDDAGNKFLNFKIDDYATVFRLVRQHVLIETGTPLTPQSLLDALRSGRSFIGFDVLADPTGFRFGAVDRLSDGSSSNNQGVAVFSPLPGRIVVFRDGEKFLERSNETFIEMSLVEPGAYRVEVYLDQLGPPFDRTPWIMSNPVYLGYGPNGRER